MTLIDKAEALLPCPFCPEGKTVSTYFDHEQGDKWGYASCDACGARGPEVRTNYDRDDNALWRAEAIAAWNRRVALPVRGVGVKPLVWRQYCSNAGNSSAPAFGGEYICERAGEYGHYGVWFPCDGPSAEPRSYHAELHAAKAAAQADYEARILAALTTGETK